MTPAAQKIFFVSVVKDGVLEFHRNKIEKDNLLRKILKFVFYKQVKLCSVKLIVK